MKSNFAIDEIINKLLEALVGPLNKAVPAAIKVANYDPWQTIYQDKVTIGKINLGLCTAKVKASYSLSDLVGLSSIHISAITLDSQEAKDLSNVTGTLSLSGAFAADLSMHLKGKLKASCSFVSDSEKVTARASTSGASMDGKAPFAASLDPGTKSCITDITITRFNLDYQPIKLHNVSGLGVFDSLAKEGLNALLKDFQGPVKALLEPALKGILNGVLHNQTPLCLNI